MQRSVSEAVQTLVEVQAADVPDPALRARLESIQELLDGDLAWIESAIAATASDGAPPASAAARHLVTLGGKRVRPAMLLLSARCFGALAPATREIALVSELLHNATLLHDDVMDEGMVRRGRETARLAYGNAISVLAGDLLLVHALRRTLDSAPDLMDDLITTIRLLVDGEVTQLQGRRKLDLSEQTYYSILRGKTASLFAFAARSGARLGGATGSDQTRLAGFGEALGIAFQLVDDVLDYAGESSGKGMAADLREGKLTLPLVIAVQREPGLLQQVQRVHAGDSKPLDAVRKTVVATGACKEVRQRAESITEDAIRSMSGLPLTAARAMLETIARELVGRAQ